MKKTLYYRLGEFVLFIVFFISFCCAVYFTAANLSEAIKKSGGIEAMIIKAGKEVKHIYREIQKD